MLFALNSAKFNKKVKEMKSQVLWIISGFMLLVFTGCATMSEDEALAESGMIPPSANYSPIQAPVYPPLNQPYSPNLLNDNDGRVMNIDRLNVGEANLPAPNVPNVQPQAQNGAQNGNAVAQNGAQNGNGNYESYEETTSDYTKEYVPSYIAPSEVVPYEQVLPAPQDSQLAGNQPYSPLPNGLPNGQMPSATTNPANGLIPPAPLPNPSIANENPNAYYGANGANPNAYPYPANPNMIPPLNQPNPNGACLYEPCPQVPEQPKAPTMPPLAEQPQVPQEVQKPEPKVPNIIPNSPLLESENVIELSAVGMGVAPENTISPSQALALAKRAAIIDAYRQIGEKMYGIKINGKDTVKDMILTNSVVKAQVDALIKNADIVETIYKDGLCQVTMELKLDGRTWSRILASN